MQSESRLYLILIICLTLNLQFLSFANAGGGSDGGGQGVVFKDGSVRFLDLIKAEELPTDTMTFQEIQNTFFEPNRYVKQLAFKNDEFFQCPIEKIKSHQYDVKSAERLIQALSDLTVLNINFRLFSVKDEAQLNKLNLKLPLLSSYSDRVDAKLQESLASFVHGRLWVVAALYKELSPVEKCALGIHESLRQLNFSNIINNPLSSKEIEIATRWFMDLSEPWDDVELVLKKLNDVTLTKEDYRKISQDKHNESNAIANKLFTKWKHLSQKEKDELENEMWKLHNESLEADTNSVGVTLSNPGIKKFSNGINLLEEFFINSEMTESLGVFQYWDTFNLKKVIRLY